MWLCLLLPIGVSAQESAAYKAKQTDNQSLAKATQNPVASLISVPFQNNTDFNFGPDKETLSTTNIQPVLPFTFSDDWNLITRTIIPVVSQPGLTPDQNRETGLGDPTFTAFLSPRDSGDWSIRAQLQFMFPR